MRKIFYIPEGEAVDDYKDDWYHETNEVHTGISESLKDLIKDPSKPQFVFIPEFKHMMAPINESDKSYFQVAYVNDYDYVSFNNGEMVPMYLLEVWTKNLDNPSEEQEKINTFVMQFDVGAKFFHTDHIRLDTGWYDLIVVNDDTKEEVDSHEITIYEGTTEEEE